MADMQPGHFVMHPSHDMCSRCDCFCIQVVGEQDPQARASMQKQWTEVACAASSANWEQGCAEPHNVLVMYMYFDLQKALPTLKISTEDVYYRRELWVYNLGIHPSLINNPWTCLWAEHEAGKGSHEIAPCLLRYLQTSNQQSRHLIT